jgi:hypothetical protein
LALLASLVLAPACLERVDLDRLAFACASSDECRAGRVCDPVRHVCVDPGGEPAAEIVSEPASEATLEAVSEATLEATSEAVVEAAVEAGAEALPEAEAVLEPPPETVVEVEATSEPEPEAVAEAEASPEPEPEIAPEADVTPDPGSDLEDEVPCIPADEVCNGVDDDCDGLIDAADPDLTLPPGTGGATGGGGQVSCERQLGPCAGAIKPAVLCSGGQWQPCTAVQYQLLYPDYQDPERLCDGQDQNCDGVADDGCDADGDGWCAAEAQVTPASTACPKGPGDCDDHRADVFPGGVEVCDALLADEDCNGIPNQDTLEPASDFFPGYNDPAWSLDPAVPAWQYLVTEAQAWVDVPGDVDWYHAPVLADQLTAVSPDVRVGPFSGNASRKVCVFYRCAGPSQVVESCPAGAYAAAASGAKTRGCCREQSSDGLIEVTPGFDCGGPASGALYVQVYATAGACDAYNLMVKP